jgi:hypothetical protein
MIGRRKDFRVAVKVHEIGARQSRNGEHEIERAEG